MSDLNGDAPEPAPAQVGTKPKTTVIRPADAIMVSLPDGTVMVEFEVSPFEAFTLVLPEESRRALVQLMTGGIVLGSPHIPDFPPEL